MLATSMRDCPDCMIHQKMVQASYIKCKIVADMHMGCTSTAILYFQTQAILVLPLQRWAAVYL